MIAAGKGNATIAHELMISLKTVRNHVSNIFTKLQVSDRSGGDREGAQGRAGRRLTSRHNCRFPHIAVRTGSTVELLRETGVGQIPVVSMSIHASYQPGSGVSRTCNTPPLAPKPERASDPQCQSRLKG